MSVANYDSFHNPDVALSGFLNTFENVINVLALITTVRIKKKTEVNGLMEKMLRIFTLEINYKEV